MNEDYIFLILDKWDNDMLEGFCEMPQESNKTSISDRIIKKLIAFSKISDSYSPVPQC
ncbi:MAG: hypothetical protein LBL74_03905 [Bacteroidales bacterium]|jgi:hypothetical protein|nr:hypothetical protein [Bacteroidales bacterium]